MSDTISGIRQEIKDWEYRFREEFKRLPGKEDIKKNDKVRELYKKYRNFKSGKPTSSKAKEDGTKRRVSSLHFKEQKDYGIDFSILNSSSDEEIEREVAAQNGNVLGSTNGAYGPTPQANGKILSIFDMNITPPDSSPLFRKTAVVKEEQISSKVDSVPEFKTPTKNKVVKIETPSVTRRSGGSSLLKKLEDASTSVSVSDIIVNANNISTPTYLAKNNSLFKSDNYSNIESLKSPTKSYLKINNSQFLTPTKSPNRSAFPISPSPLKPLRSFSLGTKKLTEVYRDTENLRESAIADQDANIFEDRDNIDKDLAIEEDDDQENLKRKAKTQKRTTRRFKLKPKVDVYELEEGKVINVHKEMEKIDEDEKRKLEAYMNSGSDESDHETAEHIQAKKIKATRKPISMNYKRLKINNPQTAAFKRRMRNRR